jgi:hypothetical protein
VDLRSCTLLWETELWLATAQSKSSVERDAIQSAVQSVTDRRVQVQYAADAEWPASNKANAPIRREFQLPPDSPFSG